MVYYLYPTLSGLESVTSNGDGYSFTLSWFKAYPDVKTNLVGYNLYIGTDYDEVLKSGPDYFCDLNPDSDSITAKILGLSPKTLYYCCVRPVEYSPLTDIDLPVVNGLKVYPKSKLRSNITSTSLIIPLLSTSGFPEIGNILIGKESIDYFSVDHSNNNLVLSSLNDRGANNSSPRIHRIDGYDGYDFNSTDIRLIIPGESTSWDNIYLCQCTFEYPNYPYIESDGYKQHVKDILTTDLEYAESLAEAFPAYDGTGYHRTDPKELLNGICVGSYIGGERGCGDNKIRGFSLEQASNDRLEQLLLIDGSDVSLIKRQWTGYRCSCFTPTRETPLERCTRCYGTGFVVGYEQYFNPRIASGQIKVRFSPTEEAVKLSENGFESTYETEGWTLTSPIIKNQDILIKYDRQGNEEFRYEVTSVTRNTMLGSQQGAQKMKLVRIRKTDPLYQVLAFRNTANMPEKITLGMSSGRQIPLHTHFVVKNENGIEQQTTSISNSHNHPMYYDSVNGWKVMEVLGHTHEVII